MAGVMMVAKLPNGKVGRMYPWPTGGASMPYVISGTTASTRIVGVERTKDFYFSYYAPMARGEPLTADLIAKTPNPYYVFPPGRGEIPDIFGEKLGVWTVKDNVKQIIEFLEPNVHTFIPVNLRVRGSDHDYGQYYLLYVGKAVDAVVIDDTDFLAGHGREGFQKSWVLKRHGGSIVLEENFIFGLHLWRGGIGKRGGGGDPFAAYLFCSDEMKRKIVDANIEGWRFHACKTKKYNGVGEMPAKPKY